MAPPTIRAVDEGGEGRGPINLGPILGRDDCPWRGYDSNESGPSEELLPHN